uniref:WAP domain-containing protein n=1 Tax=Gopherus agassizii TaxID=38772 RepID=A0A452J6V2_9SAUR
GGDSAAMSWLLMFISLMNYVCFYIPLISAVSETPGTCPAITVVCPMVDPTNRCEKERKCPENKKCCDTGCGKDCSIKQRAVSLVPYLQ